MHFCGKNAALGMVAPYGSILVRVTADRAAFFGWRGFAVSPFLLYGGTYHELLQGSILQAVCGDGGRGGIVGEQRTAGGEKGFMRIGLTQHSTRCGDSP